MSSSGPRRDVVRLAVIAVAFCALAHRQVDPAEVWIFDRLGEPLYRLVSCEELSTTNIAFGGPGQKTLFITESDSGTILAADVGIAGRTLYSHT